MGSSGKSGWNWGKVFSWLAVLLLIGAALGYYGWIKFFRELPQEDWVTATPEMRFRYGSIGGERDAGIPYWIFYVLPRVFPDKLPGPGGYASLGVSWEQGRELPIGFTKKTVGFPRVGNTCAVCHTTNYRANPNENPVFINAGPGHTLNLVAFFRFLVDCAKDPRFNADVLMREINLVTDLPWDDRLAYRFLIIPMTKKRLIEREKQFAWIYRKDFPDWGRGRDDSMNLTKYFMLELPMDDSFGPDDIPPIWNLKKYSVPGTTMNHAGDSHDAYSVIIDSALGVVGAAPKDNDEFLGHIKWLQDYLSNLPPPKYPFPIDAARAEAGKAVFDQHCTSCHAGDKTGRRMPIAGIDTDKERIATWNTGPFGLDETELWREARPVQLGAARAWVPSQCHMLLHLSVHFAWSNMFRGIGRTVRDVAAILAMEPVDWKHFIELASRSHARTCAYWTLAITRTLTGSSVPDDVLAALRPRQSMLVSRALERAYVTMGLFGTCPSIRASKLLWSAGIQPGASGHGEIRPWQVGDLFQEVFRVGTKRGIGARFMGQLQLAGRWWQFARTVSSPGRIV